jgi:rubrerythrin
MSRYIDANKIRLISKLVADENGDILVPLSDVRRAIEQTPTENVVEVRHGEWIDTGDKELDLIYSGYKCSVCGFIICGHSGKYCSECGAKMDGERKEQNEG